MSHFFNAQKEINYLYLVEMSQQQSLCEAQTHL
jgi:hypothetical protein